MKKTLYLIATLLIVSILLAACSGGGDAIGDAGANAGRDAGVNAGKNAGVNAGKNAGVDAGADAGVDAGKGSLPQTVIAAQVGCTACHSLLEGEENVGPSLAGVGPSLAGIGTRGDAGYIRESILEPNAVLVEGFSADVMPNVLLTEAQLDQLVDYLLTLD
jgi:predicted small secreted protein/cytochrome c551/c552